MHATVTHPVSGQVERGYINFGQQGVQYRDRSDPGAQIRALQASREPIRPRNDAPVPHVTHVGSRNQVQYIQANHADRQVQIATRDNISFVGQSTSYQMGPSHRALR